MLLLHEFLEIAQGCFNPFLTLNNVKSWRLYMLFFNQQGGENQTKKVNLPQQQLHPSVE